MNENRPMKSAAESFTTQVQVLNYNNMNGYKRLFGGQLMEWMDVVAAVTARRHSGRNVTTAAVSEMNFGKAAHANDTLLITGEVLSVGRSSMRIGVRAYVEMLNGTKELINNAVFVMVALDEDEKPVEVPGLKETQTVEQN